MAVWIVVETVWVVILGWRLPRHYNAAHWNLAWVGLDLLQVLMLIGVVVAAHRTHHTFALFASSAGALVFADAWFDTTTAHRGGTIVSALTACLEVPFAVFLWWSAYRAVKPEATR
jgi:hypothetical protein